MPLKDKPVDAHLLRATFIGEKMTGEIYHDRQQRFADGEQVWTSTIIEREQQSDGSWLVQTKNTLYRVEIYDAEKEAQKALEKMHNIDIEFLKAKGVYPDTLRLRFKGGVRGVSDFLADCVQHKLLDAAEVDKIMEEIKNNG